ncbi:hypothetical protein Tco_1338519 [Tanacetum coccineum]
MRTRSQSREQRPPPPEGPPVVIEPLRIEYPFQEDPTVEPMADTRTMAQLLQAPTEGYEAQSIPENCGKQFELKHALNINDQDSLNSRSRWKLFGQNASSNVLKKSSRRQVQGRQNTSRWLFVALRQKEPSFCSSSSSVHLSKQLSSKLCYLRRCRHSTPKLFQPLMATLSDNISEYVSKAAAAELTTKKLQFPTSNGSKHIKTSRSGTHPGNTITNPREDLTGYHKPEAVMQYHQGPPIPTTCSSEANTRGMDTANKIDVIDMACEEYSQEVLGFTDIIASGNSTPYYDPIVATSSPTLTPFGDSDFLLLEEADSFLEAILNSEPPLPPPSQGTYLPEIQTELKVCEANTANSSVEEPTEVELKELPPHLEVINPEICTHKDSIMERTSTSGRNNKERVNPKIHDVIKKEVEELLEALGLIYPILRQSLGLSQIHCVTKEGE